MREYKFTYQNGKKVNPNLVYPDWIFFIGMDNSTVFIKAMDVMDADFIFRDMFKDKTKVYEAKDVWWPAYSIEPVEVMR